MDEKLKSTIDKIGEPTVLPIFHSSFIDLSDSIKSDSDLCPNDS